jgi:phosphoribosylaminoimidazolecarboxamide formyltransferase/IMP cyclohydrolase
MKSRTEGLQKKTKFALAKKVFAHTAAYDGMITNYLTALADDAELHGEACPKRGDYPATFTLQLTKVQDMRYGENPHQGAAFYRDAAPAPGTLAGWHQLQGKELSFNNIADSDAAWECVKTFDVPACVIVKHANPCGVAIGAERGRGLLEGVQDRPDVGLRRHHRLQPHAGRRGRRGRGAPVRRGRDRAVGHAGSAQIFAAKQNVRVLEVALPEARMR